MMKAKSNHIIQIRDFIDIYYTNASSAGRMCQTARSSIFEGGALVSRSGIKPGVRARDHHAQ
jgi:hypothetical protein